MDFDPNSENNGRTYFIDIDGTLVHHKREEELEELLALYDDNNGSTEELLPHVEEFWNSLQSNDMIIITTARSEKYRKITEKIFEKFGMRYDMVIMDLRTGPRVVINDTPELSFTKAIGVNVMRNKGLLCLTN